MGFLGNASIDICALVCKTIVTLNSPCEIPKLNVGKNKNLLQTDNFKTTIRLLL